MSDELVRIMLRCRNGLTPHEGDRSRLGLARLWMITAIACTSLGGVCASPQRESMKPSAPLGNVNIFLAFDNETKVRLCIPGDLDRSFLPQNQAMTFLLKPLPDGGVHFLRKSEPRSWAHVEQVEVAPFNSSALWKNILAEMRASSGGKELNGFIFKTIFRTDGSQTYVAASEKTPVGISVHLRNDHASRELRRAQLSSIAWSITKFMTTKECN